MRHLALVLTLLPATLHAAPPTVLYRPGVLHRPSLVAGDLAGPSRGAPATVARAYLTTAGELAPVAPELLGPERVHRLRDGAVVRFALRYAGVPIADASVAVRLDHQGRVRLVTGSPVRIDGELDPVPRVSATAARERLATRFPGRAAQVRQGTAQLVWIVSPDQSLRLAWEIRLPLVPALAEALVARVDAQTGAVVRTRNHVRFADQAQVYPTNPTKSTLATVTLTDLSPGVDDPPDALANPYVTVLNCVDDHELTPINAMGFNVNVHLCTERSTVVRDAGGDYLQYAPPAADVWGEGAEANEDTFSELQMYYHTWKAYQYFQAFGDPAFAELGAKPLQATVNFRIPFDMETGDFDLAAVQDPNGTLYPFPNAFFMPPGWLVTGVLWRPASIVFGQGADSDFAYDGDVIYHELAHGVVWSTSDLLGPGFDEHGLDPAPTALNEAFADLFSSFIAGDGQVGEYAAQYLYGIRNLDDEFTCPDLLWGEVHQDSQAFSSAVWAIHQELGGDIEGPVFAALVALPRDASFGEAAAAVEAEITDALGSPAGATARGYLEGANVCECQRIIDYTAPRQILMTEGTLMVGVSPVPGYVQHRYTLTEPASALQVSFTYQGSSLDSFMGGGPPSYATYVRAGEPITWTYAAGIATATYDHELAMAAPTSANDYTVSGELAEVILPPGEYYVQVVNSGESGGIARNLTISHTPAPQDDAAVPQDDGGVGGNIDPGADGDSGCGCRSATAAGSGPALLLILAVAVLPVLRRRR